MRSTQSIEILCLALAALVLVWSGAVVSQTWAVVGSLAAFTAAIVAFRSRRFFPGRTRTRLLIESWSMVIFVTAVLWFTGKSGSPLFNLYLLPIILSALTLGRLVTLTQVGAIALCHVWLGSATPGFDVLSLVYASRAVGQLAPFLLVAYLTTTLSADITEARERIENLAQTDTLTGLYNLRMFNEVWQREHGNCEREHGMYALLLIDIDKLKDINDTFGHEAGEQRHHAGRAVSAAEHSRYRYGRALRRRRVRAAPAGRFARDRGVRRQARAPQCVQDHARSALAHDPLQRQHRGGELPSRRPGHAGVDEHGRP